MNNGHSGQANSADAQTFFTVGAGTNSANTNNFEAENNLDLTNKDISWADPSVDRDLRSIGSSAINPGEISRRRGESPSSPELGKIIDFAMPPGTKAENTSKQSDYVAIVESSINKSVINTEGRLESAGVKEVDDKIIKHFGEKDLAGDYEVTRDTMEMNMDNAYSRKLNDANNRKLAA